MAANLIATWAAVTTALIIAASLYYQRKHNRLSVKPHLDILYKHAPGNSSVTKIDFYLINNGLGPAVIKEIIFLTGGVRIGVVTNEENSSVYDCEPGLEAHTLMQKYVSTIFNRNGNYPTIKEIGNITHLLKDYHLPENQKNLLMSITFPIDGVINMSDHKKPVVTYRYELITGNEIQNYLKKGSIKIRYESVYKEPFCFDSKKNLNNLSVVYALKSN